MMDKMTKADAETRAKLVDELNSASTNIDEIINKLNAIIGDELRPAIQRYNECIRRAVDFRNAAVSQMEDHINSKNERWDESDEGEAYNEWKASYEELDLEEIIVPDDIQPANNSDTAAAFENLTDEP